MENHVVETAVYLLGNLFRIYIIMQLLGVFLNKVPEQKNIVGRYGMAFAFFVVNSLGYLLWHWPSSIILASNVAGVFLISLFYRGRWINRIFSSALIVALSVFSEDACYYFVLSIGIGNVIIVAITLSNLLLMFIAMIMRKFSDHRKGKDVLLIEWIALLVIPAVSMVLAIVLLENCREEIDGVIGGSGLVLINIMVYFVLGRLSAAYKERGNIAILEEQANSYKQQLEIIGQAESKMTAVRHDMKNHIIVLKSYCEEGQTEKVRDYLDNVSRQMELEKQYVSTGNTVIDSMLNYKLHEIDGGLKAMTKYKVAVNKEINISDLDLCIVLGNLLDNAVWALQQKDERERKIELELIERKKVLKLVIKNTYGNQIVKKGDVFVSTKSTDKRTGQGLHNVNNVIEKYNGEIEYSYDDKWFSVTAIMFIS